jgi:hypothetical protein
VLSLVLLLIGASAMRAQVATADLVGTVTDSSDAAVPGAAVVARNLETGLSYAAATGSAGDFLISQLPAGQYSLQVTKSGFKTWKQADISLAIGDRFRAQIRLEIGQIDQQIIVEANAVQLQTDSATVGSLIDNHQVEDLPLLGRNFVRWVFT